MDKENIVLSNYVFKGILGKGTFSKVKLAVNNITNEKVAIKIIEKQFILNKNNMDRVKREISILKNSCHPNIIKVIDIKEDSNNYYFIMEYCKLGELFLHIANNKRLDEKQASFYFFQLINGLNYLHLNKIVHRDLKPENLLLSKGKILKIIDFGLSNYTSENHYLNTPCGSPSYASPEMIKGKKYNGFLSDIWSCGIILYVMLCGYLPFEGFSNNDLFKKILKGKVNYPNSIDKSAVDLMKNILVVNPDNRFNINKIKQHPFYLRGKGIFKEKYPDLINEVEQVNIININAGINIYINKTLKKSISDSFHGGNKNIKNDNGVNEKNEDKKMKMKMDILSNSVNKNNNKKEEEKLEKKNSSKNYEINICNNLLFHTKNINYYKKILSGRLNVHNIRRNKNKNNIDIENNNANNNNDGITPRNKNTYEKDYNNNNLSNKKANKLKNKNTISLTNNAAPSSKEMRKKNLQIFLKNSPFKLRKKEKEKENSISIKTMEKYEINKEASEEKKRICTASFNENSLKSKYSCQSPNFLLLKKLLKNSQNHCEEKEKEINNIQESIVYNAQRETQIFNINHAINKIKKLKRIYENEINNGTGNEIKNKEYFSTNNSNSNFQINIRKTNTKVSNDIQLNNNYIYHKQNVKNNYDISPIRKIGIIFNGFNSNEKKNSKKKLSIHNSSQNTKNILKNNNELMIFNNNKTKNENNKENSLNKKKVNSKNSIKEKENIYTDNDNNLNHPCIYIQSPKKLSDNFEQNELKHIITNTNSLEKISLSSTKVNYNKNKNKNNSNSIKVNKKAKNINRNKKLNEKQGNIQQSSLTNKLNSIKKNFNLSNKDILILENKKEKEEISNYINNNNKKFDTTRSQKYINNTSLGETININITNKKEKKRNKYSSLIMENNSVYSEKQIKQIKNNIINKDIGKNNNSNSNKDISKTEKKTKNRFGLFNHRNNFLKKNKDILFNDENKNVYNKGVNKDGCDLDLDNNYKYNEKMTLYNEYSNLENNRKINANRNKNNRSTSNKKKVYK